MSCFVELMNDMFRLNKKLLAKSGVNKLLTLAYERPSGLNSTQVLGIDIKLRANS